MSVNSLAYKVQTERSILVFPDNAQKHAQYDEQVLQTFYVSNADVTELTQLLTSLDPAADDAGPADDSVQQDGEHDHRAGARARSCRSSSASSRRTTRRAPRSCSTSRSSRSIAHARSSTGLNLSEYALGGDSVAGSLAERHHDQADRHHAGRRHDDDRHGRKVDATERRAVAAAVQPQHDLARLHDVGLLSGRADGARAVPRERHADQARGEAAAARRRRQQDDAQPGRRGADRHDELHADCDRRRRRQPAELVSVEGRSASTSTSRRSASRSKATS